ncbi:hypothetical protein EDC94DRAFT_256932 [Helicostylum pulchrum]|nr:hypothetical protein EDC94DRAFT_256932 [Helicostylum pulchrum]
MSDYTIKCRFGDEIHCVSIKQTPTYDDLRLMMCRVFKSNITNPENIVLKYMDNEGDLISLVDDNGIIHAISISNLLKITVYVKASIIVSPSAEQTKTTLLQDQINDLKNSFKKIEKQMADINKQEPSKHGPGHRLAEIVVSFIENVLRVVSLIGILILMFVMFGIFVILCL